jgi:hypothetical protein
MQLSFSVDISSRGIEQTEASPPPLVSQASAAATVQTATNTASLMLEPKALIAVSEVADGVAAIHSAYATAEAVANYYAPLEQALGFVDSLLGAVSNFADVSPFRNQVYNY